MRTMTRMLTAGLSAGLLLIPITASADTPNAGGSVTHWTGSQLGAHYMTVDPSGCIRNDLFIHGVAGSPSAIDADVESVNLCTNTLLLLTGGTNWNAAVVVDEALQNGHAAGTIITYDRSTHAAVPVSIDLSWSGYGGLTTGVAAPGQWETTTGFHVTTPYVNVTYNGVFSSRAATVAGSIEIPGYAFPASSAQTDMTTLAAGSSNFILTFKP